MSSLVTIAIPVYRRMKYLPGVLRSVAAQDYENIDILVSDNGCNGPELRDLIDSHLDRPWRMRRNPESVSICTHFNQVLDEAQGEYFVLLSDDDEISPAFVSSLVGVLDRNDHVDVALPRLEVIDENGDVRQRRNADTPPPEIMSGDGFLETWCGSAYNFVCFVTTMARTSKVRDTGGYPELEGGTSTDNAVLLKLSLNGSVGFVEDAVFRYRVYEASTGLALSPRQLATDLKHFLEYLDRDPFLIAFSGAEPERWSRIRQQLVEMTWRTYRSRWRHMYRNRLSTSEWVKAAFEMPFIPAYYRAVVGQLMQEAVRAPRRALAGRGGSDEAVE